MNFENRLSDLLILCIPDKKAGTPHFYSVPDFHHIVGSLATTPIH